MSKNNNKNTASTLRQLKEISGLFTCLMEHKVNETKTTFKWLGPKIPAEEWHKILSFFQWTYDTTHSESQVRLYVNTTTNTWAAWAFPQKAKTGMSAQELDNEKAIEQRARFNPTDGWRYFGTVHHHCACSAFQSSVDKDNEKNQDGLHITVGDMNKERYTLHERFYLSGQEIDYDLDWFWDIGNSLESVPKWAAQLLPNDIKDRLARGQMCEKAPKDHPFPSEWKENLIYEEIKSPVSVPSTTTVYGLGYSGRFQRQVSNITFDLKTASEQIPKLCQENGINDMDLFRFMQDCLEDKLLIDLISLMYRNDVSMDKLFEFLTDEMIEGGTKKEKEAQQNEGGNSFPDYSGHQHWSQ